MTNFNLKLISFDMQEALEKMEFPKAEELLEELKILDTASPQAVSGFVEKCRLAGTPIAAKKIEYYIRKGRFGEMLEGMGALRSLIGEALRKEIDLPKVYRGEPGFDELAAEIKERGIYVVGSDLSKVKAISPFLTNRLFANLIEFAPNAMREIFGDAKEYLEESIEIAESKKINWKKSWKTADDCPVIISPDKLSALAELLEAETYFTGGAWYYFSPEDLRSHVQRYPGLRGIFNVAGGVAWT